MDDLLKYRNAIEFGLTKWIHDRQTWKYAGLMVLIMILSMAVIVAIAAALFLPFINDPSSIMTNSLAFGSSFITMVFIVIFLTPIIMLIRGYISALINIRGLQLAGHNPPPFGALKFLRLILTWIATYIFVTFSLYRPKWLLLLLADLILFVAGIMVSPDNSFFGSLLILAAFIGYIAYIIVVIYNGVRLSFPDIILLDTEHSIMDCLKMSEEITNKKVQSILGTSIVMGLIIIVILIAVGTVIELAAGFPLMAIIGGAPNIDAILANLALIATIYFIMILARVILESIIEIIGIYFGVGLYNLVLQDQGASAPASNQISSTPPSEKVIKAAMK